MARSLPSPPSAVVSACSLRRGIPVDEIHLFMYHLSGMPVNIPSLLKIKNNPVRQGLLGVVLRILKRRNIIAMLTNHSIRKASMAREIGRERRGSERYGLRTKVMYEPSAGLDLKEKVHAGRTINISSGGFCLMGLFN